jgi:hypothetical protein
LGLFEHFSEMTPKINPIQPTITVGSLSLSVEQTGAGNSISDNPHALDGLLAAYRDVFAELVG